MAEVSKHSCPICQRPVGDKGENAWFPFCSNRCKVVDLSKWLNNEYRVPVRDEDESDGSTPGDDESGGRLH